MDTIENQFIHSQSEEPAEHAEHGEGEAIPQEPVITETLSVLEFTGCKGAKRSKENLKKINWRKCNFLRKHFSQFRFFKVLFCLVH